MRSLVSALIMATALAATGLSQDTRPAVTQPLSGLVLDPAGAPVASAIVDLLDRTLVIESTTTDAAGRFRFAAVAPGTYLLRASAPAIGVTYVLVTVGSDAVPFQRLVLGDTADAHEELSSRPSGPAPVQAMPSPPPGPIGVYRIPGNGIAGNAVMGRAASWSREAYSHIAENGFHRVADDPLSTFAIDVDTASYATVRRFLDGGQLPPVDAVRIEELINYFRFDYADPSGDHPFAITTDVGPAPWAPAHRLVLVGLKARPMAREAMPPCNLVFLLDVSGSMDAPDKLPMVKTAMRMLTATLTPADRVAIVVYAGASGVALPSTSGADKARIDRAIADLHPGGSTNGAAGIRLAYDIAAQNFIRGGINRVILATDGDFNVGVTSHGGLTRLIEEERKRGVFLTVLGVGTGNLQDSTMEQLANKGNGNYAYLDSLHEARRVLIAEAGTTLVTVAKDVKIQVEFNPARVGAYRLIGYENRLLADRDFNDDTKDAGEMGAGHTVTALYEIVPPGVPMDLPAVDPLKYQRPAQSITSGNSDELLTVKVRYKQPDGDTSQLLSMAVADRDGALAGNLGFAAAVAEFGMLLRRSEHAGQASWVEAAELARRHRGADPDGYRAEFVRLVDLAAALAAQAGT
jgi:Ca-activated chloride channel family protein